MTSLTARPGPDDQLRCHWALNSQDERHYHDTEWGSPVRDTTGMFERLALEGFQAGLSWVTVLRKRPALREVFHGFEPAVVAEFGTADIERLCTDPRLIRNRPKIEAVVTNARATVELSRGLAEFVWNYAPNPSPAPRTVDEIPVSTQESNALAKALKKRGFRFVGPTTIYAAMQATGMVNDHLVDCVCRDGPVP